MYDLPHLYLIALGSNQRHPVIGSPSAVITEAVAALEMPDIDVFAASNIMHSAAIGPSQRQYANAAAIIATPLDPPALLCRLKSIEAHFGVRRAGQKWRARVLDLDIILWSGGIWSSANPSLGIPHSQMHKRRFVLQPAAQIAPDWRDPISGMRIKYLYKRIIRPKRLDPREMPD